MRLRLTGFAVLLLVVVAVGAFEVPAEAAPDSVRYRFGLLRRGPSWTAERNAHTDSIQAGHMANIRRMAKAGALLAAGPFEDGGDLRGVFLFKPGAEGLDSLMAGDPAIASGRLVVDLHTWVAPPGVGDDHRRRAATGAADSMVSRSLVLLSLGAKPGSRPSEMVVQLIQRQGRQRANGGLIFAGPVEGSEALRGVLVFAGDRASTERALNRDPAVRSGRCVPQVLTWWHACGTIPGH